MDEDYRCKHAWSKKGGTGSGPSSFHMQDPKKVFDAVDLRKGEVFVDIGCGAGDYSFCALEHAGNKGYVYAFDRLPEAIDNINRVVASKGIVNMQATVCDVTDRLPLKDGCADVCFVSTVLHTLDIQRDGKLLFGEMRRILKPSGRLVVIECKKDDASFGPPMHMRISPGEMEDAARKHGFEKTGYADLGFNYLMRFKINKGYRPKTSTGGENMCLRPVGFVRNETAEPFLAAGKDGITLKGEKGQVIGRIRKVHEECSEIVIDESYADLLEGVDGYSHIMVLYWAHKVPEESRSLIRVHPMGRQELAEKGIFATCSPARPNPVLVSVVRLCGREGNVLKVKGLDAINASPVIDIKPYVKENFPQEDVCVPEWMKRLTDEIRE